MHEDEDEATQPITFMEGLGDHGLPDNVRRAIVLAALRRFIPDDDVIEEEDFSDADNKLAKSVMFHGPFTDLVETLKESVRLRAVVVSPTCTWTDDSQPHYIASLSN